MTVEQDILKGNLPIYHIERAIVETRKSFGDGAHTIYVNGEIKNDTPLGLLMQDISCTNPEDMNYEILVDCARFFKQDKEGQKIMCKIVEDIVTKEVHDTRVELAKEMLQERETIENYKIYQITQRRN